MQYLRWVTALALFLFLYWWADWQQVLNLLRTVAIQPLVVLLGLQLLTVFLAAWQWHALLEAAGGRLAYGEVLRVHFAGTFVENLTPGAKIGGDAARIFWLRKISRLKVSALAGVLLLQKVVLFSTLFLVTITVFGGLYFSAADDLGFLPNWPVFVLPPLLVLVLLFMGGLSGLNRTEWFRRLKNKYVGRILSFAAATGEAFCALGRHGAVWWVAVASLANWGLYPLKLYLMATILNLEISFLLLAAAGILAYVLGMLPLAPGGLGSFEAVLAVSLITSGIAAPEVLALAVLYRLVTFVFPTLLGGLALWSLWGRPESAVDAPLKGRMQW